MRRTEISVIPGIETAGRVDEIALRVPEEKGKWECELKTALTGGERLLCMPAFELSEQPSKNFQVIGMLFKTAQAFFKENTLPEILRINCPTAESAAVYKQIYNFYIPRTKDERIPDDRWD